MVLGQNVTRMSNVTAKLDQRLMSGAMWTSSANGMLNLLICSYLMARTVNKYDTPEVLAENVDSYYTGLVEGDDGICVDRFVDESLIQELGLSLKFDHFQSYRDAAFCQILCTDDGRKICNIKKTLRKFFCLHPSFQHSNDLVCRSMLRAKAMSLSYLHHDCPILGMLAWKVCEMTRGYSTDRGRTELESWALLSYDRAVETKCFMVRPAPSMDQRLAVERHFNIPVSEQLRIEMEIESSEQTFVISLGDMVNDLDLEHSLQYVGAECDLDFKPWRRGIRALNGKSRVSSEDFSYFTRMLPLDLE